MREKRQGRRGRPTALVSSSSTPSNRHPLDERRQVGETEPARDIAHVAGPLVRVQVENAAQLPQGLARPGAPLHVPETVTGAAPRQQVSTARNRK